MAISGKRRQINAIREIYKAFMEKITLRISVVCKGEKVRKAKEILKINRRSEAGKCWRGFA